MHATFESNRFGRLLKPYIIVNIQVYNNELLLPINREPTLYSWRFITVRYMSVLNENDMVALTERPCRWQRGCSKKNDDRETPSLFARCSQQVWMHFLLQ